MQSIKKKQLQSFFLRPRWSLFFLALISPILVYEICFFCIPTQHNLTLSHLQDEYTYESAINACTDLNMQLPSMQQLIALSKNNQLPRQKTDYWSQLRVGPFAFGWSTRKGMPSFDPISDLDHVVCVQPTAL